jgi:molybdate-binding protein
MLAAEGMAVETLNRVKMIAKDETDLAVAVRDGKADAGLAIEAVARQFRLGFVPLVEERYDLVLRRRDYFEAPVQSLLALARTPAFRKRANELGGYDISDNGRVVFNSP